MATGPSMALARRAQGLIATACVVVAFSAAAPARSDAALDIRLKALESQLRCLVCQNQTLAESEAPLAEDLRKEVRALAVSGKSDDDIRAYLVARYGDFVLYKPPVKPTTWLLWFGPFLLLACGVGVWWAVVRRRATRVLEDATVAESKAVTADSGAIARARVLLDE
ncbi:MAG TPA: cytochrome c-type biogenesis protein [Casimicrobiaceae bacterium]|jgi:cytochrome c-type biogenesis protein CcmH